jgi:hypothetical protein
MGQKIAARISKHQVKGTSVAQTGTKTRKPSIGSRRKHASTQIGARKHPSTQIEARKHPSTQIGARKHPRTPTSPKTHPAKIASRRKQASTQTTTAQKHVAQNSTKTRKQLGANFGATAAIRCGRLEVTQWLWTRGHLQFLSGKFCEKTAALVRAVASLGHVEMLCFLFDEHVVADVDGPSLADVLYLPKILRSLCDRDWCCRSRERGAIFWALQRVFGSEVAELEDGRWFVRDLGLPDRGFSLGIGR